MLRPRLLPVWPLVLALGCKAEGSGDDLPPGAFTSGPEDDGVIPEGSATATTSTDGDPTSDPTSDPVDTGSTTGTVELSHAEHILPIWTAGCVDSSCHDADAPQAGLDLATDGVYERICTSFHPFSGMPYIDCEGLDPQFSYIFRKLEGTHTEGVSGGSGLPMPPAGSLPASQISAVEAWISGGALP